MDTTTPTRNGLKNKKQTKKWEDMTKLEKRRGIIGLVLITLVVVAILSAAIGGGNKAKPSNNQTQAASDSQSINASDQASQTPAPARQVRGTLTTLGAGDFNVGSDVPAGTYDVTPGTGQSGNFIVKGSDGTSSYNEVLGDPSNSQVAKVRAALSVGDQIEISGLNSVTFTPVTAPFVTSHATTTLYPGTFIVGQDIGAGRYVATPAAGESGNFIVHDSQTGMSKINEVLGSGSDYGQVPNVATYLNNGDIVEISGIDQVTLTATN